MTGVGKTHVVICHPAGRRPRRGSSGVGAHVLRSPVTPGHPYITGTAEGGQPGRLGLLFPSESWRVHSPMVHEGLPGPPGTAVSEATARISQSPQSSGRKGQPAAAQTRRWVWPLTGNLRRQRRTHIPGEGVPRRHTCKSPDGGWVVVWKREEASVSTESWIWGRGGERRGERAAQHSCLAEAM